MSSRKHPNARKAYIALYDRIEGYVSRIDGVYARLNLDASKIVSLLDHDETKPFLFKNYPQTKEQINRIRKTFANNVGSVILGALTAEWANANLFNDNLAEAALKQYGAKGAFNQYFQTNNQALNAFIKRRTNGLNLSDRIWNISGDYKSGLEAAISNSIEKGIDAVTLSKRISKYLHDYPKLRKDYTERFGKAIHINDCEYQSARLARTEINMAYRTADIERWQQLDFVVGYEIKRSGRKYPCPVCEALAGKYPKEFKFIGWHPNCRCYMVSILKTNDEFWDYDGRSEENTESSREVKYVPYNFKEWMKENKKRIEGAKVVPYFIRENRSVIGQIHK